MLYTRSISKKGPFFIYKINIFFYDDEKERIIDLKIRTKIKVFKAPELTLSVQLQNEIMKFFVVSFNGIIANNTHPHIHAHTHTHDDNNNTRLIAK